ncbi:MAG: kinase [Candidatus Methanogranum gryphiswaldense]|nr:MAG: kinase [Candidatus Methanogranum sp. U3.2.1]
MVEYIRARAPLRIGFAGDGTDLEHYTIENKGCVVGATIDKFVYCTLMSRNDHTMSVHSTCYGRYKAPLNGHLELDGKNDLIKAVANHFDIRNGFQIILHTDVPAGSGLGGSSAALTAVIAAVSNWIESDITKNDMAKLVYDLEKEVIGVAGGEQDQFESVFGGFNMLEFENHHVDVEPLGMDPDILNELQCRSVLCYVGRPKQSEEIIKAQVNDYVNGINVEALAHSKQLAVQLANAVKVGDFDKTGELIDKSWECKKKLSRNVTNHDVDKMIRVAKMNGAIGGKLTGTGGGGFMYLLCEYDLKVQVVEALKSKGAMVTDFMFEPNGVNSWRSRNE